MLVKKKKMRIALWILAVAVTVSMMPVNVSAAEKAAARSYPDNAVLRIAGESVIESGVGFGGNGP